MKEDSITQQSKLPNEHPTYGLISLHRVNCNPAKDLVGSNIQHYNFVELVIKRAEYHRDKLYDTWYFEKEPIIKVALSPTQLGELFSSMNTKGTPCTIEYTEKDGDVKQEVPTENKIELHKKEFDEHLSKAINIAHNNILKIQEGLSNKMGKKEIRKLLHEAEIEIHNLRTNSMFAIKQFDSHIENRVSEAKQEISILIQQYGINPNETKLIEFNGGGK